MAIKHGDNRTGKRSKLYMVWVGMRSRCRDPKHISYKYYGALGIYVDERWDDYSAFREWSYTHGYVDPEPGVRSKLEIDRVDERGPYAPENCRWVTKAENLQTLSRYKRYPGFGELKTMGQWSKDERCVTNYYTLRTRLNRGWSVELALTTPTNKPGIKHSPKS